MWCEVNYTLHARSNLSKHSLSLMYVLVRSVGPIPNEVHKLSASSGGVWGVRVMSGMDRVMCDHASAASISLYA